MQPIHLPNCTLVMIAKDEGPYLIEWIAWHRLLRFESVVIYDNASSDGSTDLLARLAAAGVIEHRPWPLGAEESPQMTAYIDAVPRVTTDWLLFIDADEFLVLHRHDTVGAFLGEFCAPNAGAVGVNWRLFGDSGLAAPDGRPVTERFTRAAERDFYIQHHIKSFTRVRMMKYCDNMHACKVRGYFVHPSGRPLTMAADWGKSRDIEHDVAQINHYFTRTAAEFEDKKRRGRGGFAETAPEKHNYDARIFEHHNRNEVEDLSAAKRSRRLRAAMAELEAMLTKVPA